MMKMNYKAKCVSNNKNRDSKRHSRAVGVKAGFFLMNNTLKTYSVIKK